MVAVPCFYKVGIENRSVESESWSVRYINRVSRRVRSSCARRAVVKPCMGREYAEKCVAQSSKV